MDGAYNVGVDSNIYYNRPNNNSNNNNLSCVAYSHKLAVDIDSFPVILLSFVVKIRCSSVRFILYRTCVQAHIYEYNMNRFQLQIFRATSSLKRQTLLAGGMCVGCILRRLCLTDNMFKMPKQVITSPPQSNMGRVHRY